MTAMLFAMLLTLPVLAIADGSEAQPVPTEVSCDYATVMLVHASDAVAALLNPDLPVWLREGTCYLWQQPGVALVITDEWRLKELPPEVWISEAKLQSCFTANLKCERPPLRITEEYAVQHGGMDGLYIEPAMYLLDAPAAQERIGMYADGLAAWAEMNEGMEFIMPSAESLTPSCALVYLDSTGPLEFYFVETAEGELSLAHIVCYDFFSA